MSAVYGVIRKLGATSKYKGYYYVVDAVEMAQKIYERPVKVTKDIYPVIARKYKSTPSNVEHNIRTLVNLCWMNHKDTLEEMAGQSFLQEVRQQADSSSRFTGAVTVLQPMPP